MYFIFVPRSLCGDGVGLGGGKGPDPSLVAVRLKAPEKRLLFTEFSHPICSF
jgi:hypothetical protein